jgi:hypothetical protein
MRTSIAVVVPAPSRTVVLSLSIVTFYRRAQVLQRQVLEPDAEVVGDRSAVGEDGEVLEHRLSPVAVAGCLDGSDLQRPSQLVHDQRRKRLTLDVLGDHEQRLAAPWFPLSFSALLVSPRSRVCYREPLAAARARPSGRDPDWQRYTSGATSTSRPGRNERFRNRTAILRDRRDPGMLAE